MLSKLELTNFRNWPQLTLDLPKRLVLVGLNGSGKTNILEAIYLLAVTRSWRTKSDRDLVKWDEDVCRLVGTGENLTIEFAIQQEPYLKKIRINGLDKKATEAIGQIVVVLFEPRLVNLVYGPPMGRRRFLDVLLAQVNQDYAKALVDFQIILRQRNSLLRKISAQESTAAEAKFWNEELIKNAQIIWQARQDFFLTTGSIFSQSYQELSGKDLAEIRYQPSTTLIDNYRQILEEHWINDLDQGTTSIGPHRDDFTFILNEKNASEISSQGEARSLILALKRTEIHYLSTNMGKDPILLFDDVFSELDLIRRRQIISLLGDHQTIMTTTEVEHLDPKLRKEFTVVEIEKLRSENKK